MIIIIITIIIIIVFINLTFENLLKSTDDNKIYLNIP